MLDLVAIGENPKNPTKVQKISLSETNHSTSNALTDFTKNSQLYDNLGLSNDVYLVHHGLVLENNFNDCYNLQLTFSERKEDSLIDKRKEFFQKFFMFDRIHVDLM